MIKIEIQNASQDRDIPAKKQLQDWATSALDDAGKDNLTIRIVDEEESAALNRNWRGREGPTNVLSFPYGDDQHVPEYLGDIVLCAPVIKREASEQGKPVEAHWAHMIIHGILHLQGYDHQEQTETEKMEQLETRLLNAIGFENPYQVD
ncbi:MAG TPA: rRNA maturation RNase YbeY [Gammaproteobacteria bacterium]|nr:rRNA maturation RNase YbeY [Gammaproteobacteria bacterium]